jgi:hypothetical protein
VHVRNQTAPGPERDLTKPGDSVRVFRGQGLMGKQSNPNGLIQKGMRIAEDTLRVLAQQNRMGVPIGGGSSGGPTISSAPGAQGDKGKTGTAPAPPPPAPPPPPSVGH